MNRNKARLYSEYLVARARSGDREGLRLLVRHWEPKLLSYAYRLCSDRDLARDIAQECWADIIKGLPRLSDTALFPAWAYKILTRRAADIIRKRQRLRRDNERFAQEPEGQNKEAANVEARADQQPLITAIQSLPDGQKAVVILFYLEDLSTAEIAAALKVPVGTVKTRLMHGRAKLRAYFKGHDHE